nr:zinc finger, CCHC-type [Tanacetum cinerariifolium]
MTNGDSVRDMMSKFDKLVKFEGQDFYFCDHKFTTKIEESVIMTNEEYVKDMTSKFDKLVKFEGQDFRRWQKKIHFLLTTLKVVYVLSTHNSLFDIYQNAESAKAIWESLEFKYMAEDTSAMKFLMSNFMNYKMVDTRPVMEQYHEMLRILRQYTQHNLMMDEAISVADDEVAWWVDSRATSHVCKDLYNVLYVPGIRKNLVSEIVLNKCGYKQVLESDKYILLRHGSFVGFGYVCNGMIRLNLNYPLFNASTCMNTSSHSNSLSKSELWHARLGHVHYKRMKDMYKMSLIPAFDKTRESCKTCMLTKITRQPFKGVNQESKVLDLIHSGLCDFHANPSLGHNKYVITFIDDASRYCYVYLLHSKHEALDKFKIYKQEVELQRQDLIKVLRTDRGGEYYDPVYFQSTGIIHQTTAPYTPQQNGVAERKNITLKEMVNSMLSYSRLSERFWESKDAIFDEERLSSIPRPRGMIQPCSSKIAEDEVEGTDDVPGPSVLRKSTRTRKAKSFGSDFEDPRTLSETMASRDVAFWKEAVHSETDSIMHNDTWELTDLPHGCKALGCKWILKMKMKVDGNIDKIKLDWLSNALDKRME